MRIIYKIPGERKTISLSLEIRGGVTAAEWAGDWTDWSWQPASLLRSIFTSHFPFLWFICDMTWCCSCRSWWQDGAKPSRWQLLELLSQVDVTGITGGQGGHHTRSYNLRPASSAALIVVKVIVVFRCVSAASSLETEPPLSRYQVDLQSRLYICVFCGLATEALVIHAWQC